MEVTILDGVVLGAAVQSAGITPERSRDLHTLIV